MLLDRANHRLLLFNPVIKLIKLRCIVFLILRMVGVVLYPLIVPTNQLFTGLIVMERIRLS